MGDPVTINLRHVARGLEIPVAQVQVVVELLDEGNTVPFITRYRKDQTGGLDEEQIRQVRTRLVKLRMLAERKQTILRSIQSQGNLSEKLTKQIHAAGTTKRLEDLYFPYKPKKQTLATIARGRGLETLADEILQADSLCADLDARAADFANPDREIPTAADALLGAGHILAERFSEQAELRQRLREILQRSGKLLASRIEVEKKLTPENPRSTPVDNPVRPEPKTDQPSPTAPGEVSDEGPSKETKKPQPPPAEPQQPGEPQAEIEPSVEPSADLPPEAKPAAEEAVQEGPSAEVGPSSEPTAVAEPPVESSSEAVVEPPVPSPSGAEPSPETELPVGPPVEGPPPVEDQSPAEGAPSVETGPEIAGEEKQPAEGETAAKSCPSDGRVVEEKVARPKDEGPVAADGSSVDQGASDAKEKITPKPATPRAKSQKRAKEQRKLTRKEQKKKKAQQKIEKAFSDYFDYAEEIKKIPSHRVLAINRGERAKVLRVKMECDTEAMHRVLDELCVPEDHPHVDFLRGCCRDALSRLILPGLEREIRREMTDRAEAHAVSVFARNLRNLLLQPPVCGRRVLAVDPGYKSGCKLVALDQFGNVLAHGVIYLIGKPERKEAAKRRVTELVDRFRLSVVTIGNGSACRQTEDFFAELIGGELKDRDLSYVIVNEAGASVYSTNRVGREEFPDYDATLRGAISIGRRLLDPLSELVKIDPANIGVGLYQHDVKAKHLRASLDEVVESCVNYVGVDVNTASPALLRYVSGLNQLTARRLCEYRLENGPFRNREQFRQVPGFGEMTFVQAAGFLKITSGDNPLDATWIHPESYEVAGRVMNQRSSTASDLAPKDTPGKPAEKPSKEEVAALAEKQGVGTLLLDDILAQLARPGRDPRDDLPAPIFKRGVVKIEDLDAGMELAGTVLNVVDFGAFIDIGMHDSGLVHVSQLADKFVRDPHDVIAVGDIVKVWVVEVDKARRRVSLTMIKPGTKRSEPRRDEKSPRQATAAPGRQRSHGDRKPRGKGPPRQREKGPPKYRPKKPPKPVVPITDGMATGREPMRTFSDLAQFFQGKVADQPEMKEKGGQEKKKKKVDAQEEPRAQEQAPPAVPTSEGSDADSPSSESSTTPVASNETGKTTPDG